MTAVVIRRCSVRVVRRDGWRWRPGTRRFAQHLAGMAAAEVARQIAAAAGQQPATHTLRQPIRVVLSIGRRELAWQRRTPWASRPAHGRSDLSTYLDTVIRRAVDAALPGEQALAARQCTARDPATAHPLQFESADGLPPLCAGSEDGASALTHFLVATCRLGQLVGLVHGLDDRALAVLSQALGLASSHDARTAAPSVPLTPANEIDALLRSAALGRPAPQNARERAQMQILLAVEVAATLGIRPDDPRIAAALFDVLRPPASTVMTVGASEAASGEPATGRAATALPAIEDTPQDLIEGIRPDLIAIDLTDSPPPSEPSETVALSAGEGARHSPLDAPLARPLAQALKREAAPQPPWQRTTILSHADLYAPSALPFLVLGPLARIGWLDAVAAMLEARGLRQESHAFATALAYKLADPPARGWRRSPAAKVTAALLSAKPQPTPDPDLARLALALREVCSVLDAVLAQSLVKGASASRALLLLRPSEDDLLLLDTGGMFPIGLGPSERVCGWLAACGNSAVHVSDSGLARELRVHGVHATVGVESSEAETRARAVWRALAVERPAVPLAPDGRLARSLTLAVWTALADIAWTLWREREPTDAGLALERFADLDATVRFSDQAVRVRLPLGPRHRDLYEHGLLRDVHRVPWLSGRRLEFTGG